MGWSPDGKTILVGEYDSDRLSSFTKLQVWLVDITGGKKQELVESNGLTGYDWSPDGKRIMVECYNGKICLVDPTTFEVIQTRYSGNTVGFSPDSRLLSWDNFPPQNRLARSVAGQAGCPTWHALYLGRRRPKPDPGLVLQLLFG